MPRWGAMDRSSRAASGTSAASTIPIVHRSFSGSRRWREDSFRSRCGGACRRSRRGRLRRTVHAELAERRRAHTIVGRGAAMRRFVILILVLASTVALHAASYEARSPLHAVTLDVVP